MSALAVVSRNIMDLHPRMQPLARQHLELCQRRLHSYESVIITCTWRSNASQDELYAQGRTKPGKIVTRARSGESMHNYTTKGGMPASLAYDVVVLRHGRPIWGTSGNGIDDDPTDDEKDDLELWQRMAELAKPNLEWAGGWKTFREFPHFQHPTAAVIKAKGE